MGRPAGPLCCLQREPTFGPKQAGDHKETEKVGAPDIHVINFLFARPTNQNNATITAVPATAVAAPTTTTDS